MANVTDLQTKYSKLAQEYSKVNTPVSRLMWSSLVLNSGAQKLHQCASLIRDKTLLRHIYTCRVLPERITPVRPAVSDTLSSATVSLQHSCTVVERCSTS